MREGKEWWEAGPKRTLLICSTMRGFAAFEYASVIIPTASAKKRTEVSSNPVIKDSKQQ